MRIAFIEVGHWHAGQYIKRVRELGEEVVGVSDRNLEVARARASELGCRAYASHAELLAQERPEFVFAHGMHAEMTGIAAALVASGVPFVMEKPMGVDWRSLEQVAGAAARAGLFAGVNLPMRGYRAFRELLRLRDSGELGCVTGHYHRLLAGEPQRYRHWNVPWVLERDQAGGGPLFNFGPHVIDLLLLLAGQEVESVFCRSSSVLHGLGIEDYSVVSLGLSAGAVSTIEVGYVCPDSQYDDFYSLCTDKLFVSLNRYDAGRIRFRDGRELDIGRAEALPDLDYTAETLRRFRAGEPPVASMRDMVRALRVINAATESAACGEPVSLASPPSA